MYSKRFHLFSLHTVGTKLIDSMVSDLQLRAVNLWRATFGVQPLAAQLLGGAALPALRKAPQEQQGL
jgi:hypothetical protein